MNADRELLEAALAGYQHLRDGIEEKIADIRRQMGASPALEPAAGPEPKRRVISAAGRRRIAAAQRKRWVAQKLSEQGPAPAKKRAISAAGRKHIAEATRKRWAAYRAQKAAVAKAATKPAKKVAAKRQVPKKTAPAPPESSLTSPE
jgi:hypothetical protein